MEKNNLMIGGKPQPTKRKLIKQKNSKEMPARKKSQFYKRDKTLILDEWTATFLFNLQDPPEKPKKRVDPKKWEA